MDKKIITFGDIEIAKHNFLYKNTKIKYGFLRKRHYSSKNESLCEKLWWRN